MTCVSIAHMDYNTNKFILKVMWVYFILDFLDFFSFLVDLHLLILFLNNSFLFWFKLFIDVFDYFRQGKLLKIQYIRELISVVQFNITHFVKIKAYSLQVHNQCVWKFLNCKFFNNFNFFIASSALVARNVCTCNHEL